MPLHDWSRLEAWGFHGFQLSWFVQLTTLLNRGGLPKGYYIDSELVKPEAPVHPPENPFRDILPPRHRLVVRRTPGDVGVAVIEIVSPVNKQSPRRLTEFTSRVAAAIAAGMHVLVVDIFPPGRYDPHGIHGAIWKRLGNADGYTLPSPTARAVVSYAAGPPVETFLDHPTVGNPLPDMPLFLTPDRYVTIALDSAYQQAYPATPFVYREVLDPLPGDRPQE